MKVYLSSTYTDLQRHRAIVARKLRKARYEVVMMEEYVARDQRVEFACRGDVIGCDIYVGVFAWRHGHVPEDDNPARLSVTEMEYAAAQGKMARLTFLLDDKARWPKARIDADRARIDALRAELKKQCSDYFANADGLAADVLAALRVHESTEVAKQLEAIAVMLKGQELGSSYMMNIKNKLADLGKEPLIEIQLGPTPWWNTRLHLVAALAQELGQVRGIVFVDAQGRYLSMATPAEVRHRLALRWPPLEQAYANLRREALSREDVEQQLYRYPTFVGQAFGADEQSVKHVLSDEDVGYELGIARDAEVVDVAGKGQQFLLREILGRQTPYAALLRERRLEGLVDRAALAQRVAQTFLSQVA